MMRWTLMGLLALAACAEAPPTGTFNPEVRAGGDGGGAADRGVDASLVDGAVATDRGLLDRDLGRDAGERPEPEPMPTPEPTPNPEPGPTPEPTPNPEPEGPAGDVDCSPIAQNAEWQLCESLPDRCGAIFEDGAGCAAVCARAGLRCVESHENIDDHCEPDLARPALGCADTGHQSDYCVCQRGDCRPDCTDRACGSDGCGGTCGAGCGADESCRAGECVEMAVALCTDDDCAAFPGAEGEGRNARGGRGGDVCRVTSLADDGAGTLRRCLTGANGPRTVVFEVAGYINLNSPLRVDKSNLTIAGQTAPGDGITIRDWQTELRGNHLIVQHIRFRAGDRRKATQNRDGYTEDSVTITGNDIMIDHVSASWGIDECLSSGPGAFRRITVQYAIIAEGLHRTRLFHGEYDADHAGHSMGGLYKSRDGDSTLSVHHNLFAHNNNRNPGIGNYEDTDTFDADIRNNVIYDCPNMGYVSGASERVRVNYVGNYGVYGPDARNDDLFRGNEDANVKIFQQDNKLDINRNRIFDGIDFGWIVIGDDYDQLNAPVGMAPVTTHPVDQAIEIVLEQAGARPWSRDRTDTRVVRDVRENTGGLIDSQDEVGWGELAAGQAPGDADRDGMPDDWERGHGCDPQQADNNRDANGDGYTNLENYLHWAARLDR